MPNKLSPIALFCYNRPKHTLLTLRALNENKLADNSVLYIFADGPKPDASDKQLEKINEVRDIIKQQTWCKETHIKIAEQNQGLAQSIINGVTQVVNEHGKIIVLEDDHYTSPAFLRFMNKALDLYEKEDKVISIHGYTYPVNKLPNQYFLKGADCWGWATWKRGWDLFEEDGERLLHEIQHRNLGKEFNFQNSYNYLKMLKKQVAGENSSWAIRWYAAAFLQNKLTLYPGISYIKNIGLDGSGTHSKKESHFNARLLNSRTDFTKINIIENKVAKRKIAHWFRMQRLKHIFQKLNPFS